MKVHVLRFPTPKNQIRSDAQIQNELDELVEVACAGDRRALGAIAIAMSRLLLREARAELGDFQHDAADVLQDFFTGVAERRIFYVRNRGQGRALGWMRRVIREMARRHRAERERDWGVDRKP
jgi:hypothetical protein